MLSASPGAPILLRKRQLTPHDKATLLDPYLPPPSSTPTPSSRSTSPHPGSRLSRRRILRPLLTSLLHKALFLIIHAVFALYLRFRRLSAALRSQAHALLFYHHRSPELMARDVAGLTRIPAHVGVILERRSEEEPAEAVRRLMGEVAEISAWSCAGGGKRDGRTGGVEVLSVYERSGILKSYLPTLHKTISATLSSYYGSSSTPQISVHAPHTPSYPPSSSSSAAAGPGPVALKIHILSSSDSLTPVTDLTRTLATLSQSPNAAAAPEQQMITSTWIDEQLTSSLGGVGEPDLLVLFGPRVVLQGFPCWQLRLTEIFASRDHEGGVAYQVWLRALYRYAKVEMRFGR